MPQNSEHPEYIQNKGKWKRCIDAYEGSDAVKAAGPAYLPRLTDQIDDEYKAYVARAMFYGATERTVQGLAGAAVSKPFEVKYPASIKHLEEDATSTKMCMDELVKQLVKEELLSGRVGILVDRAPGEGSKSYLVPFTAPQIINWEEGDGGGLRRVVLEESYFEADANDKYKLEVKTRWRELTLENGYYEQLIHTKRKTADGNKVEFDTEVVVPLARGKPLDFIPFVIVNAYGIGTQICKPPLLALVDVNLSHYRNSADLEHGRHYTGLPTPWVSGAKVEGDLRIGSGKAWVFEQADAKVGYLEFTGQGLATLERAMESKEKLMAVLGARLLESQKAGVEAYETVRVRQMGDVFTLDSINSAVADGLALALSFADRWEGGDGDVEVEGNKDFMDADMKPEEITALVGAWQAGGISIDTLLWNLKRGERLPPDVEVKDEKALIEAEGAGKPALPELTDEERAAMGLPPKAPPGTPPEPPKNGPPGPGKAPPGAED